MRILTAALAFLCLACSVADAGPFARFRQRRQERRHPAPAPAFQGCGPGGCGVPATAWTPASVPQHVGFTTSYACGAPVTIEAYLAPPAVARPVRSFGFGGGCPGGACPR